MKHFDLIFKGVFVIAVIDQNFGMLSSILRCQVCLLCMQHVSTLL